MGGAGGMAGAGGMGGGGAGGSAMLCQPMSTMPCYSGQPGTEGIGICKVGTQMCNAQGTGYDACVGEVTPGQENCATAADEDCDGQAPPCAGSPLWVKTFVGNGSAAGRSVAVDGAGNVAVTGEFSGSFTVGNTVLSNPNTSDIFVVRLDPSGAPLWAKRYGDGEYQYGQAVAMDAAGAVIVTGNFVGSVDFGGGPLTVASQAAFAAKLDAAGNYVWAKSFGSGSGQGHGAAIDSAGNVILAGQLSFAANFGGGQLASAGEADIFVAKLDSSGGHLWSKRFGDGASQQAHDVAVDAAGNVYVTGPMAGTVDFGGGALTSLGGPDLFLVKLDASGNHVWSKRFGDGAGAQTGRGVAVDAQGNLFVAGEFSGTLDFGGGLVLVSAGGLDVFAAKLSPAGDVLWARRAGDADISQFGSDVAAGSGGGAHVCGRFRGTLDFGGGPLVNATMGTDDAFFAGLDASGNQTWARRAGDSKAQLCLGAASDASGALVATGFFGGTTDFGTGPKAAGNNFNLFVAKYAP
jgi:hypothetical protein